MYIAFIIIGAVLALPLSFFGVTNFFSESFAKAVFYMAASIPGWILIIAGILGHDLESHIKHLKR